MILVHSVHEYARKWNHRWLSNSFVLNIVSGLVSYADLDERAIDALREFNEEGAMAVLQQFKESDLSHVQVK